MAAPRLCYPNPRIARAAVIYTITQTAILNDLDPEASLREVLTRISKIDELLPCAWSPDNAASHKAA